MEFGNEMDNQFLVHGKSGLSIYRNAIRENLSGSLNGDSDSLELEVIDNSDLECTWSLDRSVRHYVKSLNDQIAIVDDRAGLSIVHAKTDSKSDIISDTLRGVGKFKNFYTPIGCKNIKHLQWSDNGTYLAVYFNLGNYSKENGVPIEDNLHIWDIFSKNIVGTFCVRRLSPDQWPIIKWVGKSDVFVFCNPHQVSLYSITCPEDTILKNIKLLLEISIVRVFSVVVFAAESGAIQLACFSKADVANQIPGDLRISTVLCNGDYIENGVFNYTLPNADSAEILWSPSGKYLLLLSQSTVDLAGEKYGSSTDCLLFSTESGFMRKVNSSTVHDARWNPTLDEFVLMQGNMPCDITLYRVPRLEIVFDFPKLYRNMIKWSDKGNMIALCGFGNLAGELCFWYKEGDLLEKIVQLKEPCTVIAEWSRDSRFFMIASTFPRMKVDNFVKIFTNEGDLIVNLKLDECYSTTWLSNDNPRTFTRPKVKKIVQRKAIYRPKCNAASPPTTILTTTSPKSFFSGDQITDPSVNLLEVFKHVFSLSQTTETKVPMANNAQMPNGNAPHNDRVKNPTALRNGLTNNEAATKSLSMLTQIKNKLSSEKSHRMSQSGYDEEELLRLLVEAKDRSLNRKTTTS
ncbi:bifunctional Translation initiation factor 2A/Translation initiation factor [Babesia duncani]|uniref:Bifunctional Translation initiation factor 2A/Translation initiation factor n=1 Tax=Babesia duncani TaxID=323732 RepID=A0AAD9UP32_9APIC|nr:bifunctional Translation initiation factor 2A/Translation initiation factor [Babesia duncani]